VSGGAESSRGVEPAATAGIVDRVTVPGHTLRPLADKREMAAAVALQREIWGEAFQEIVPAALLWAVQRVGGVAAGGFDADGELVALVFGFSGWRDGERAHWSDLLAVRATARGRGLGVGLKLLQRRLLLADRIASVGWTFDPLESRNAYINFARLGIVAREYVRDLYGESGSPLHEGVGTDRLIADWRIGSERVRQRLAGVNPAIDDGALLRLPPINAVTMRADGAPVSSPPDLALDAPRLRLAIPAAIQAMKESDPALGAEWRQHTRAAFETYLRRGYIVEELVRAGATSCYVLGRATLS
jgi:predicted GNAT superfamily acetyltransferase